MLMVGMLVWANSADTIAQNTPAQQNEASLPATKPSVVVLHNDSVIQGTIESTPDRLIVSNGPWYVIRVPRRDVDFIARDFEDAFQTKRGRLRPDDVEGQIKLAHWCLRHDLDQLAARQLVAVVRLAPHHAGVKFLESKLRRRVDQRTGLLPPVRFASHRSDRSADQSSREQANHPQLGVEIDGVLDGPLPSGSKTPALSDLPPLPPEAMGEFTRSIQPLVFNRCGQATCHGAASKNDFRLVKGIGRTIRRELTWRNLRSVMAQVDVREIQSSPILIKAVSVHGTAKQSPIGPREDAQLQRLIDWVSLVAGDGAPLSLATRHAREADDHSHSRGTSSVAPSAALRGLYDAAGGVTQPSVVEDPFDPGAFNDQN